MIIVGNGFWFFVVLVCVGSLVVFGVGRGFLCGVWNGIILFRIVFVKIWG